MVQGSCSGRVGEVGQFTPFIIILAILLLIPAIILLGHRRPHGSIVLSSGAAIVVFSVFWLLGGTVGLYEGSTSADMVKVYIIQFLLLGGLVLLIASWTLSLNAAAQARRWLWQALLVLAGLITFCMKKHGICHGGMKMSKRTMQNVINPASTSNACQSQRLAWAAALRESVQEAMSSTNPPKSKNWMM